MNMSKKVTMQDIADRLNISKNSVSQALTGKPGVSEKTRQRVQKTAEEMGYEYSPPRTQQSEIPSGGGNILLIASDYAFSFRNFFGEIYLSVEKEVKERGMNLYIESISSDSKDGLLLPTLLEHHSIDGILILSHISTEYIEKVISTGIPTVLIDHHEPSFQADAILTNNRFGAFTAVEHLIRLGHKKIGFIGDIDYSPSYQERLEGYLLALKKYSVEPCDSWIYSNAKESEGDIQHFVSDLKQLPTAWFCVNDAHGFLITSVMTQMGFKVPEDAAVCSFDNGQLSQLSTPKTTTMGIDLRYFGKKAVEQLIWRISHPDEPFQEILLPAKLLVRESTVKIGSGSKVAVEN